MPINNPSFELPGFDPGTADDWTIETSDTRVEIAVFDGVAMMPLEAREDFEESWAAPQSVRSNFGSYNIQTNAFSVVFGLLGPLQVAVNLGVRVTSDLGPVSVSLRVKYINQDGVANRFVDVTIPGGATRGQIFYAALQVPDTGFQSVTNIAENVDVVQAGAVAVEGQVASEPFNELSRSVFGPADLEREPFGGAQAEGFEGGWKNDAGRLDDFAAILSAAAAFDGAPFAGPEEPFEDFEEFWKLPRGADTDFGTYDVATAVYTDITGLFARDFYNLALRVTTTFAGLPVSFNITYVNQAGVGGRNATVTIPGLTRAGDVYYAVLQAPDTAVRDVTAMVQSVLPNIIQNGAVALFAQDANAPLNQTRRVALEDFIDGTGRAPFTIAAGSNDRLKLEYTQGGTSAAFPEVVLTPGTYATAALMAQEIEARVDAALDADIGGPNVNAAHFAVQATPNGRSVRLRVSADIAAGLRLLEPASASAWLTLGFATGPLTERFFVTQVVAVAGVSPETFESGWRSNELSIFSFAPANLAAALLGAGGLQTFEAFESDWVLVMTP